MICGVVSWSSKVDPNEATRRMAAHLPGAEGVNLEIMSAPGACFSSGGNQRFGVLKLSSGDLLCQDTNFILDHGQAARGEPSDRFADHFTHPERIDGEYAIVLYRIEDREVSLLRDRVGAKPLYVMQQPGEWLAFSSTIGSLRSSGLIDSSLDYELIARWLLQDYSKPSQTHFSNISRVRPGHLMRIRANRRVEDCYWELTCKDPIDRSADYDAAVSELGDKIVDAVRRRLPATGPAFSHLSGGLDSSAIAAIAARDLRSEDRKVHGYSFAPEPLDALTDWVDERPSIEAVAAMYANIDHHALPCCDVELLARGALGDDFPSWVDPRDGYSQLLADAASRGANTVLSGFGGDQVASYPGAGALAEKFAAGEWISMYRMAAAAGFASGRPASRMIASEILRFIVRPRIERSRRSQINRSAATLGLLLPYLKPERIPAQDPLGTDIRPDTRWLRVQRFRNGHLTLILEELAWRAARHGLSYSYPLMDRDVLEFAVRLPPDFLVRDGHRRAAMRDAMRGILPEYSRLRRRKLVHDAAMGARFALLRDQLVAVVDGLSGTAAENVFALPAIRADIAALPDYSDAIKGIETAARLGQQDASVSTPAAVALKLARYVAAHGGQTARPAL